jgi:hypothetical protein
MLSLNELLNYNPLRKAVEQVRPEKQTLSPTFYSLLWWTILWRTWLQLCGGHNIEVV